MGDLDGVERGGAVRERGDDRGAHGRRVREVHVAEERDLLLLERRAGEREGLKGF